MGQQLYAAEPAFRASVDACDLVARERGIPVASAFRRGEYVGPANAREARRNELVQLGVIQLALCDLWSAAGVTPDAVLSLSLGEMTCPYAAGVLTRDEAVAVLCEVMHESAAKAHDGVMWDVGVDAGTARDLCLRAPVPMDLVGALVPGRALLYTAARDTEEGDRFLTASGHRATRFPNQWSQHTTRATFDLERLELGLAHLKPQAPHIPMFSSIAGDDIASNAIFDALHFHWMLGHPFWYADAVAAALRDGPVVIVSIGANPVTTPWIRATAGRHAVDVTIVESMRHGAENRAWTAARTAIRRASRRKAVAAPERIASRDPAAVNLADPDVVRNPFFHLDILRRTGPVHHLTFHQMWLVLGHPEVRAALDRPDVFSSRILAGVDADVIGADPPHHTLGRRELSKRFDAAAVASLGTLATRSAESMLDALCGAAEFDLVADFAAPLGERVAGLVLGLDNEQLARVCCVIGDPERDPQELFSQAGIALAEVLENPQPVQRLLWFASTTTTKRAITAAVLLLVNDPSLRSSVSRDRALLPALVDEAIRLHPPERSLARITVKEAVLGGTHIPAGSVVHLCVAAANRDPARFPDPDAVDLDRRGAHLAFGGGPHRCPGARLARIEAEVALAALLDRMPAFRSVHPPCALRWIPSISTHGVEQLMLSPRGYAAPRAAL